MQNTTQGPNTFVCPRKKQHANSKKTSGQKDR